MVQTSGITTIPSFIVENFDGKENEDTDIDPNKVRYTTDGRVRTTSSGAVRIIGYGRKPFIDPQTGDNNPESDRDCYIYDATTHKKIRVKRVTTDESLRKVSIINKPKKKSS